MGTTYTNDNITRKSAPFDVSALVVKVGKCSGIMLDPEHVLTSAHCVGRCGYGLTGNSSLSPDFGRFFCSEIVEKISGSWDTQNTDEDLDYAIIRVSWLGTFPPPKQKYAFKFELDIESQRCGESSPISEIFTVGFPKDKSRSNATIATGYCKDYILESAPEDRLRFNVGVFEGNSGGPLISSRTGNIIGIVIGGRHRSSDPLGRNNDLNDPDAWNYGLAIKDLYQRSAYLKSKFPHGKSQIVDENAILDQRETELFSADNKLLLAREKKVNSAWFEDPNTRWKLNTEKKFSKKSEEIFCPETWSIPSVQEVANSIEKGMTNPKINKSFGDVFSKFVRTFWVKNDEKMKYFYVSEKSTYEEEYNRTHYVLCVQKS